jgi:beta-lactamase regulating signal transducer with metallopeptidase domain
VPVSGIENNFYQSAETWLVGLYHGNNNLLLIWLMGSLAVSGWSLLRIYRFNRLLRMDAAVASPELQETAARIAGRFGLKTVPAIYTTSAHLSPMVWWIGGRIRVVLPAALLENMESRQFQWILAHELAHVRRRDYMVRWLEWLACDALVISSMKLKHQTYADSLLKALEFLMTPVYRPPAMASEINSGGFLKKRFALIVTNNLDRSNPRWLLAGVLLCALLVLPLGLACQKGEVVTDPADQANAIELNKDTDRERDAGIEDHFNRFGISDEKFAGIKNLLNENEIGDEQIEAVLGGMIRIVYEMQSEGDAFELNPRLLIYFQEEIGLKDEQVELITGLARRIAYGL